MNEDFLIWWCNKEDQSKLKNFMPKKQGVWPDYIWVTALAFGNIGPGNVRTSFPTQMLGQAQSINDTDAAEYIDNAAGIVIKAVDYVLIKDIPGIVTTLALNRK